MSLTPEERKERRHLRNISPERREKQRQYNLQFYSNLRNDVIKAFGSKCKHCGFSDPRALQLDHINGGGSQDKLKYRSYRMYKEILEDLNSAKKKFQLLCANCNWIKRAENHEVNKPKIY